MEYVAARYQRGDARRRNDLAHRHVRSAAEFALLGHRQSPSRGSGDTRVGANLYTCTIVALNPDTGKLVWYFQSSPHDTHDWDMVMTPVFFDGTFNGKPRKMLAQAGKNGLFFVLDRTNGKALISEAFVPANWVKGYDDRGEPIPDPEKEPKPDGVLVTGGVGTNWQAPSYDP